MKKNGLAIFILVTLCCSASVLCAENASNWEKIGNDDGIAVFKKEVPGSPLVAFRGEGVIDAPLWKVFSVMADDDHATEWVDDLAGFHVVRNVNRLERVEYNHIGMPFIVKDRDFVMDVKVIPEKSPRKISMFMHSTTDPLAPETKYVRGEIMNTSFILTSIDGDQKTFIDAEVHVDPKGNIPAWLVNLIQKGWPHNTISKLRTQCAKPGIAKFPNYETLFQ